MCLKTFPHKRLTIRPKYFNASPVGEERVELLNHPRKNRSPRGFLQTNLCTRVKTKSDSPKLTPYKPKLLDIFGWSRSGRFNGVCAERNRITTWVNTKSEAGLATADRASV